MSAGHYQGRLGGTVRLRKAYKSQGDDNTLSRWVKVFVPLDEQLLLLRSHRQTSPRMARTPAAINGRSIFYRKGVTKPSDGINMLVSGHSNAKIGRDIRKGKFRGYWIYTLSLEERRTCPSECVHWTDCYGNNMPYATRVDHTDPEFLTRLEAQIHALCHPQRKGAPCRVKRKGVMIRLHALGDFYSPEYVAFWGRMLVKFPSLAIYGYTARTPADPIGFDIATLKSLMGERFAIRWSNGQDETDCTISVQDVEEVPTTAFVCPEQFPGFTSQGKPILCATCGLCWSSTRNVAFLEH